MTLNGVTTVILRYGTSVDLGAISVKWLKLLRTVCNKIYSANNLVFGNI